MSLYNWVKYRMSTFNSNLDFMEKIREIENELSRMEPIHWTDTEEEFMRFQCENVYRFLTNEDLWKNIIMMTVSNKWNMSAELLTYYYDDCYHRVMTQERSMYSSTIPIGKIIDAIKDRLTQYFKIHHIELAFRENDIVQYLGNAEYRIDMWWGSKF